MTSAGFDSPSPSGAVSFGFFLLLFFFFFFSFSFGNEGQRWYWVLCLAHALRVCWRLGTAQLMENQVVDLLFIVL